MRRAFTLIELLIVVAIIAILAAIAVPNFLEAQVRSKVSRSKADMRTLATAVEAYWVDWNKGPTDSGNGQVAGMVRPYANGAISFDPKANFSMGYEITTPVAYISSLSALRDIFKVQSNWRYPDNSATSGRQYYNFFNIALRSKLQNITFAASNICGNWVLMGAGPDQYVNNNPGGLDFSNVNQIPDQRSYDPTNGTVSHGDIYRTQKYGVSIPERS